MKLSWSNVAIMPIILLLLVHIFDSNVCVAAAGGVFHVQHKFAGQNQSFSSMKDHDTQRHERLLHAIQIPLLGAMVEPYRTRLFYTTVKIGTPLKEYRVHIDSATDLFWINCAQCNGCPRISGTGVDLTQYDPSNSSTSNEIKCDQEICTSYYEDIPVPSCSRGALCEFEYEGDEYSTSGYLVKDVIEYSRISGNFKTTPAKSSVVLGCARRNHRKKDVLELDGLLGFGQSNFSMLSQLAASGEIKKKFSHCFGGGAGIFSIGDVVKPNMKTTPIVPNGIGFYKISLIGIVVGKTNIQLPKSVLNKKNAMETILDFSTSFPYLPEKLYSRLMYQIYKFFGSSGMSVFEGSVCFETEKRLSDVLPIVTMIFEGSLKLELPPEHYTFPLKRNYYCTTWQVSPISKDGEEVAILGVELLKEKLVTYDLEKQAIGWADNDCYEGIEVPDEQSNSIYKVVKDSSSTHSQEIGSFVGLLVVSLLCHIVL